MITYWDGRLNDSVRYARQGAGPADRSHGTAAVWLSLSEARAHAALGKVPEALHAIERAEATWDTATGDELDELGGICTFTRPRQLYYAADVLAWLPSQARQAQRETDGAREAIAPVLDLPADQRIHAIIRGVQHVHTALRRPELPPATRELQEEIEDFTSPLRGLPS